ncbi:hypothetical protein BT67DRAFT_435424 [Trichocladium antarcticum]|uniref:Uncharacterized protein n=1 Tax=Trichocladium antarcticum TaxID=1450529 RepID=A0AAN6ZB95_9PEZI|nr:hypothetical protein BT67DRAFT_435424 [Trichocladium antarcticum]
MSPPFIIGDSSPFLKRVLIPFWVIRILIMLIQIALYAIVIAGLSIFKDDARRLADEYNTALSYEAIFAVSCIIMAIILFCLILDIVSIVKRSRRTLTPPFFFGVNLAQSIFYVANFILAMIGARNGPASIGISVVVLLSFLGLLIYASVVFHQYRSGSLQGAYAPAHNPEAHNLVAHAAGPAAGPAAYAHDYPKTAYYDQQGAQQAHAYAYAGAGAAYAPQPYEPQSYGPGQHGQTQGHQMAHGTVFCCPRHAGTQHRPRESVPIGHSLKPPISLATKLDTHHPFCMAPNSAMGHVPGHWAACPGSHIGQTLHMTNRCPTQSTPSLDGLPPRGTQDDGASPPVIVSIVSGVLLRLLILAFMSYSPYLGPISRTQSRKSVFREEFDSHHPLPHFDPGLGDMASSPTLREVRRLASDHDYVLGAHPPPRRLGLGPFIATHLSLPAALCAGMICVVVAIVYTTELSKQMLECPSWANTCRMADPWTIENLGTIQGIITLVYMVGMVALAHAALGLCEAAVWPVLHKQSFTISGLNAYLSTTRGSIMSAPAAIMSVKSLAAGLVLVAALTVTLLPFAAPPLVGRAYSPASRPVQLESNYTPGGGISDLYAQTNPPTSVIARVLAEYESWATDPTSEPMPAYRAWYIDRKTLSKRGNFTAKAVRFETTISCAPRQLQQMKKNGFWWNAFLTNMTRTNNNSTRAGEKNSSAEVWVRPVPQLTLWADSFDFVSERRTRTTLVFAALNGSIEGGSTTPLALGNLTSASSVACDIDIEAVDDILLVGNPSDSDSDPANLPVLSSTDTLALSAAASPQTRLNELLLWFTSTEDQNLPLS